MSYRAGIKGVGESSLSYNSLYFATSEEAEGYAKHLRSRWMGMDSYVIEESTTAVNYRWTSDGLNAVPAAEEVCKSE